MKPPLDYLYGIGNLNFEDPALICSELQPLDNTNQISTIREIPETQLDKELEFELLGPSEIT